MFTEKEIHHTRREINNRELLSTIDAYLIAQNVTNKDVSGIMVVVGEGSFTSSRLATTVANTFAYVEQIPVLAISMEQSGDPQILISSLLKQPAGQYISATYSAPPTIHIAQKA